MANGEWRVGLRSVDLGDMAFLECPIKLDDGWDSSSLFPDPYSLIPIPYSLSCFFLQRRCSALQDRCL